MGLGGWERGKYPISKIMVLNEFSVKPNDVGLRGWDKNVPSQNIGTENVRLKGE